jgi:hypothetical protein
MSNPRRLAPLQAFSSQSGGGAAVRMKSSTLMITSSIAAAIDDEAIVVPGRPIDDLTELGAGDMGVDAAFMVINYPGRASSSVSCFWRDASCAEKSAGERPLRPNLLR